ncbi:MAG: L,D-transpeptidase, partial [Muribaculaceae bacterium]|nr:L,D-transpeptidase [Muribaculaceae bacterium]
YIAESENSAEYHKGILPDMIKEVPEYAVRLLMSRHDGFLIVDKATMKIYRYNRYGVLQESVGMACSKNFGTKHARRDNRTPEGFFSIEGKYDSTDWLYTDDDGNTSDVKGQFGPRFMRLKIPNTSQIGIHGTCAPWSIGGRRSHGCIRVTNENILRLFDIVQVGWPVIVSPGRKDFMVNSEEGYDIPTVPVIPGKPRARYTYHPSSESTMTDIQNSETPTDTVTDTVVRRDSVQSTSHTDTIPSL